MSEKHHGSDKPRDLRGNSHYNLSVKNLQVCTRGFLAEISTNQWKLSWPAPLWRRFCLLLTLFCKLGKIIWTQIQLWTSHRYPRELTHFQMYIYIVQFDIVIKRTPFQGFFDKDSWLSIRLRLRAVCQNAFGKVLIYDDISDCSLNVLFSVFI